MFKKSLKNGVAHPLNTFRTVVGGKEYDEGNHVYVLPQFRQICIEFDSDWTLSKKITAKNFLKKAAKEIDAIPPVVELNWFREHGWYVPKELKG